MRCDECRHWNRDAQSSGWESDKIGFHPCSAVRERWVIQDEATPGRFPDHKNKSAVEAWSAARSEALRASRAYVQDGSEYYAELVTGPDYFCALFEANK